MPVLSSNSTRRTPIQVMLSARTIEVLNALALDRGIPRSAVVRDVLEAAVFSQVRITHQSTPDPTTETKEV